MFEKTHGAPAPDDFLEFTAAVDAFKVRAQLEAIRKPIEYSVGLSSADKEKIRFFIDQIKTIIEGAGLPEDKRDALLNKLNKFLAEADRNRAPWTIFADLVIYMASVGGKAAKKLEPARKWIDSIGALLGHNKEVENSQQRLPKPIRQERIEDRRSSSRREKPGNDLDDEVPF